MLLHFLRIRLSILIALFTLSACTQSAIQAGPSTPMPAAASVHITIDRSTPMSTSQFSPGITYVDNSLSYPSGNNTLTAVNAVKGFIKQAIGYQNTAIMAWGAPDPWPDPSQTEPSDWSYLDQRLQFIISTGGTPVLTLCEAPWWMKGVLQADGSTHMLTASEEWADSAYDSRILDNKMGDWLHLVQRVAERYMAPPYNVRYFQVWNELKGYYDPANQNYDYDTSPGDPGGPNAKHGYTYMYNQVYARLMHVASSLGISTREIKIGGPYAPISTLASPTSDEHPPSMVKSYGTYDQNILDAVQYWLSHKDGAGFITIDGANSNDDNRNLTDPFTASEKFADVVTWIRSLNNMVYPGAATLPVWWAEWYANPYTASRDDHYDAAVKTYAMIKLIKAGGALAFSWGGTGDGMYDMGLWTDTSAGGGRPHSWYEDYKTLHDDFAPGTKLYRVAISAPQEVEALASSSKVMLVNKVSKAITVVVNAQELTLAGYQVDVVNY